MRSCRYVREWVILYPAGFTNSSAIFVEEVPVFGHHARSSTPFLRLYITFRAADQVSLAARVGIAPDRNQCGRSLERHFGKRSVAP